MPYSQCLPKNNEVRGWRGKLEASTLVALISERPLTPMPRSNDQPAMLQHRAPRSRSHQISPPLTPVRPHLPASHSKETAPLTSASLFTLRISLFLPPDSIAVSHLIDPLQKQDAQVTSLTRPHFDYDVDRTRAADKPNRAGVGAAQYQGSSRRRFLDDRPHPKIFSKPSRPLHLQPFPVCHVAAHPLCHSAFSIRH